VRLAELAAEDPTVGFEASNHYYYTPHLLRERVLNCRRLLEELESLK
jgi:hypothetical protein